MMENVIVVLLTLLTFAALIYSMSRPTYNDKLRRKRRAQAGEPITELRSAKRKITEIAIGAAFFGILLFIFYFVPWVKIAPTILALLATLTAIVLLSIWINRVTYVWPTEIGEASRTVHRRLYRTLQTTFSNFLKKHGFKLSAEPKSGNELDFWFVTFRSEFFDLSIGGRGGIGVYGRPRYCQEDWYSIPLVFALLDGVNHIVTGNDDLDRLAQAMDERHAELGHFFSPQGNDTRLEFAQWTEKEYWRMWGRDDVPKDAA